MIGGSAGAAIGCFIGNLVNPGLGGYVGSLIGGFLSSAGCALATDRYFDPQSYSIEKYESIEVSEIEKEKSYLLACAIIQVSPFSSSDRIKSETKAQYLRFHPDKNGNTAPQEREHNEKMFI